jgi:GH24 family phage-related lysozyme (muramidase)
MKYTPVTSSTDQDEITSTYNKLRFDIMTGVEGLRTEIYIDSNGIQTIGAGMNLRDSQKIRSSVVTKLFEHNKPIDDTKELDYRKEIKAIVTETYPDLSDSEKAIQAAKNQRKLNAIMARRSGNPSSTFTFNDDEEIIKVYDQIAETFEKIINQKFSVSIPLSYERLALFSLAYNQPTLLGTGLQTAIKDGNRADAWYQIRYQSNGGESRSRGIAKRRYFESQIFGLYSKGLSDEEKDIEYKSILKMRGDHASKIKKYDKEFGDRVQEANNDFGTSIVTTQTTKEAIKEAETYLIYTYAPSATSINEILIASNSQTVVPASLITDSTVLESDATSRKLIEAEESVNTLIISDGLATSYFREFSGSDYIASSTNDGIIKIGGVTLSGDALQKKDLDGNIISNQWTLGKFSLIRNSNNLLIAEAGSDFSSSETSGVTIVNYPFDQNREAFGFRLTGKLPDLAPDDAIGNPYSSRLGYNKLTKSLATSYNFPSCDIHKTSDEKGLFTLVAHNNPSALPQGIVNNPMSIISFNSYGEQIGLEEISEYPVLASMQGNNRYLFKTSNPQTGKDLYVYPFDVYDDYSSDVRNSKVGICVIDDLGKKVASKIISQASLCQDGEECFSSPEGQSSNKYVFACKIVTNPDDDFFYIAFQQYQRYVGVTTLEQKVNKITLENIGDSYLIGEKCCNQNCATNNELYFPNGNKVRFLRSNPPYVLYDSSFEVFLPKLRDLTSAEVPANFDIPAGDQLIDFSEKSFAATVLRDKSTSLAIAENPNSIAVLTGFDNNPGAKAILPINDQSDIQIFAITESQYSTSNLLAGKFSPVSASSSRILTVNEEYDLLEAKVGSRALLASNQTSFNSTLNATNDDYYTTNYYSADDYSTDDYVPTSILQNIDQPSTVIYIPSLNQTIALIGVNATELAKTPEAYFFTQSQLITDNPTSQPTSNPSAQPSTQPSSQPSRQPFSNPSAVPSYKPQAIPSFKPSSQPTHHPIAGDLAVPTSQPSVNPSLHPSQSLSFKPQAIPSFKPTQQPVEEIRSKSPTTAPTENLRTARPTTFNPVTTIPTFLPTDLETGFVTKYPTSFPSLKTTQLRQGTNSSPNFMETPGGIGVAVGAALLLTAAGLRWLFRKGEPRVNPENANAVPVMQRQGRRN